MKLALAYHSSEYESPVDVLEVDTSCTTHGATITTRRNRHHEGTVLAYRIPYLANIEDAET